MPLVPGTRLGAYEILSVLGAGGMGQVYRARDPHLERDIAIKILAPELARDAQSIARFEREARTVSSLNHPHIVHIYDIGVADTPAGPAHYIAMELVDGEALRARLRRGQRWSELGELLVQVADALGKAHRAGVIHRDLKPENIMVAADGYAKVVDFGLAKLAESADTDALTAMRSVRTEAGMIVGTVGYMSPEQAMGRAIDARSDVFSFGCILYEVIAGRQPFKAENSLATLHAIAYENPPPIELLNPSAPAEPRHIAARCLAKDPAGRYQSMADAAADLRACLRGGADSRSVMPTVRTPSPRAVAMKERRTVVGWIAIGAVTAVAGTLLGNWMRPAKRAASSDAKPQIHTEKVTNRGTISRVALSPDGRYIAYATFNDRRNSIWLRDLTEKSESRLVGGTADSEPYDFRDLSFRFAKNSQALFYSFLKPNGGLPVLYRVALVGGETRLIREGSSLRGLSPDDRRLEFIRSESGKRRLIVSDLVRGQEVDVADVTDAPVMGWVPDGTRLLVDRPVGNGHAFVLVGADGKGEQQIGTDSRRPLGAWWNPSGSAMVYAVDPTEGANPALQLMTLDVRSGKTAPLGDRQWQSAGFALNWVPASSDIVVAERDLASNGRSVWRVSYPEGKVARISAEGSLGWESLSFSEDGSTFAAVEQHDRCDLLVGDESGRTFTRIAGGTDVSYTLCWTPSRQIVHSSNDAGSYDLYVMDADGSNRKRLTFDRDSDETEPAATPDGKYIVFVSNRAGERALYRINSDGAGLKAITTPTRSQYDSEPRVTPDSRWIFFQHRDNGPTLWKIPIDGGTPALVNGARPAGEIGYEMAYGASPSPDGRSLAFFHFAGNPAAGKPWSSTDIVVTDLDGRIAQRFFVRDNPQGSVMSDERVEWSRDGRALYFRQLKDGASNVWMQPIKGGAASPVTRFDGTLFTTGSMQTFAWSLDGKSLACTRSTSTADVVVVSNFR